jgi:hypothetical protein
MGYFLHFIFISAAALKPAAANLPGRVPSGSRFVNFSETKTTRK